ncbi:hypothetical protein H0H93_003080 [Arthromyces matolae]|nr:hypothetical protein H0H93_003080 [Arthromyces matolae]
MSAATTETPGRSRPRTDAQKLKDILNTIRAAGWSLPTFLFNLFRIKKHKPGYGVEDIERDAQHQQMLSSLFNGAAKPTFGSLMDLMYQNAQKIPYRKGDNTIPTGQFRFTSTLSHDTVDHAYPAMTIWAVQLVANLVRAEAETMIQPENGLHLRAAVKSKHDRLRETKAAAATWEAVDGFSMDALQGIAQRHATVLWHIVSSYINPTYENQGQVISVREARRPQHLAHHTIFRVESRLAQSVAYSTVYTTLSQMAEKAMEDLKASLASGVPFLTVGDNVQTYAVQRDHRIGKENKMIKGYAGTVVEMQDVEDNAFDLQELLSCQAKQERKTLSVDMILDDIDFDHQENVSVGDFLQTLIEMVPALSLYKVNIEQWTKVNLTKNQIPPTRKSKVIPLATNSADEMHVQGMKQGLLDFFSVQMGINEETLRNRCFIKSGDGKTFDQLHKLKKYSVSEKGDFQSFRWLVPLLELWHAKWTDLSRVARAHWGKNFPDDPSTLEFAAKITESPSPTDLRKVDFYKGQHIVNLTLNAHILCLWQDYLRTDNLQQYFDAQKEANTLSSFEALLASARVLVRRYGTTTAFQRAHNPEVGDPYAVPEGTPWTRPPVVDGQAATQPPYRSPLENDNIDQLSDLSDPEESALDGDITLANSILFIRNAIWWREMCRAVARGDTGRIWEILKIWIFTFAGSGNPYYSQYLMELYCNFKWEFPPNLRAAILMNWVVNLHGKPGVFIEMDLMQEHFNFWLEEMAQHKGKEFDEPFYRKVLSMNVHHFLRLKDEMEGAVSLKGRTKKHGEPHLKVELNALMKAFKNAEVHRHRSGRNEGFCAVDDFGKGITVLRKDKLKSFIERTTAYSFTNNGARENYEDSDEEGDVDGEAGQQPPPRMILDGSEIITVREDYD